MLLDYFIFFMGQPAWFYKNLHWNTKLADVMQQSSFSGLKIFEYCDKKLGFFKRFQDKTKRFG